MTNVIELPERDCLTSAEVIARIQAAIAEHPQAFVACDLGLIITTQALGSFISREDKIGRICSGLIMKSIIKGGLLLAKDVENFHYYDGPGQHGATFFVINGEPFGIHPTGQLPDGIQDARGFPIEKIGITQTGKG